MSRRYFVDKRMVLVLHVPHPTLQGRSWCGKPAKPVISPPQEIFHCQECTLLRLGMQPL